jgi:hypothetical protein
MVRQIRPSLLSITSEQYNAIGDESVLMPSGFVQFAFFGKPTEPTTFGKL